MFANKADKTMQPLQFNTIFRDYYKKSYHFSLIYVRDTLAAEDIATESLIKLWEVMKRETVDNPIPLLMKILKNKSLDYLRKQSAELELMNRITDSNIRELNIRIYTLESCNPESIYSKEIQNIMFETLKKMPEQTQHIFKLSRIEQKSCKEIAEMKGISIKGVDYHIAKVLKELRISLKDYLTIFF